MYICVYLYICIYIHIRKVNPGDVKRLAEGKHLQTCLVFFILIPQNIHV